MKLLELTAVYNHYTFTNHGIPSESHGGKVKFTDGVVETTVILTPEDIQDLMETIAIRVSNRIKAQSNVSASNIADCVNLGNRINVEAVPAPIDDTEEFPF